MPAPPVTSTAAPSPSCDPSATSGTRRRSQEERSAGTRAKVIEAAISSLYEVGYAATTTGKVASRAGVSRGAMTHQFPNKVDLMEAVVTWVYEDELREYDRLLTAQSPRGALRRFPWLTWTVLSRPSAIAVVEIMMASRSDAAMAERLGARQSQIESHALAKLGELRRSAGIADPAPRNSRAVQRLVVAAVRGLAIEALFTPDRREIEKAVELLSEILRP